jgi:glycosyltransferase involved in cell wall biosynthesis
MGKRILIAVSNDLVTDQRVLKVSGSLFKHGYEVFLIGRRRKNTLNSRMVFPYKRLRLLFNRSFLFYAELNIRLFLYLLFSKADIYYANDTDTLPACFLASKIRKKQLIFDAHELFPETPELRDRPFVKKFWTKIEDLIFPHLNTSFTVCDSIANYYRNKYGINMQVLRNVPHLSELPTEQKITVPDKKIILYQGAINMGRGLEWVINAMPYIKDAVLYIIGDGDLLMELKQKVKMLGLESKVIFHGKVSGKELQSYTSSGDIGLCLLENKGLSYYYSLPNRVFAYLHAHVPILASPFPEIVQIVKKHHTGILTDEYEPHKLAATIQAMLENPMDTTHFDTVKKLYCWEQEEKILLEAINRLSQNKYSTKNNKVSF